MHTQNSIQAPVSFGEKNISNNSLEIQHNIIYTVSSISIIIKNAIDNALSTVAVKGEVSGLKIASSGHVYFNLKDSNSLIACTCWKHVFKSIKIEIQDGAEITVYGKVTIYPNQSKYQISVDKIDDLGVGALMKLFQERKEKLEKEGFFNQKRNIPSFPKTIGIVTSLTGAVIMDMINRIKSRFPLKIIIWPSSVQGSNASKEIAEGIKGFNNMHENQRPDLIIVARGGGSVEDLWCFNEEIVVKALFESKIVTISAVGHETDFTLSDFAADLRASTPTAAAEISTPVLKDLKTNLLKLNDRLHLSLKNYLTSAKSKIDNASRLVHHSRNLLNWKQQKLDMLMLKSFSPALINNHQKKLNLVMSVLKNMPNVFNMREYKLKNLNALVQNEINNKITGLSLSLISYGSIIKSMSVDNILKKGFNIARVNGSVVSSKNIPQGELSLEFKDGIVNIQKK